MGPPHVLLPPPAPTGEIPVGAVAYNHAIPVATPNMNPAAAPATVPAPGTSDPPAAPATVPTQALAKTPAISEEDIAPPTIAISSLLSVCILILLGKFLRGRLSGLKHPSISILKLFFIFKNDQANH
ncbi:hypothetical protein [Rugamonas sp.]|uniref:hypothetical protein n=1 Tax=Rugamonas sp. TaxID=1926287 RepID=UPI0025F2D333|nr:hypothetical protein [Rugamonas sp.]